VRAGTSATLLAATTVTGPRPPTVTRSATGLPTGVTGTFDPPAVVAGGTSVLALEADADAPATVTDITIEPWRGFGTQGYDAMIGIRGPSSR
jgi:hypothetical protein